MLMGSKTGRKLSMSMMAMGALNSADENIGGLTGREPDNTSAVILNRSRRAAVRAARKIGAPIRNNARQNSK